MINTIKSTEDYSSFAKIVGNRKINQRQVERLYNSFKERPDLSLAVPILVNDKMEIIDGQHRIEALERLASEGTNLPVNYVQINSLGLKDVQILNSATKNWTNDDYARSFAELGKDDYKIYLNFHRIYGLCHNTLVTYLAKSASTSEGTSASANTFRTGKFKVNNESNSHKLCQNLLSLAPYYKKYKNQLFAAAFRALNQCPEYNHKRMLEKMSLYGSRLMVDAACIEDYKRMLEKIYNFHSGSEYRVKLF